MSRIRTKIIITLFILIVSCLFSFFQAQNTKAICDDSDLEAEFSAIMNSNSAEITGGSMTNGSYNFFEPPQLDVGTFTHTSTSIDLNNILSNSSATSDVKEENLQNISGPYSILSNSVPQQFSSSQYNTRIVSKTNFSANYPAEKVTSFNIISGSVSGVPSYLDEEDMMGSSLENGSADLGYVSDYCIHRGELFSGDLKSLKECDNDDFICSPDYLNGKYRLEIYIFFGWRFSYPIGRKCFWNIEWGIDNYTPDLDFGPTIHHLGVVYWDDNNPETVFKKQMQFCDQPFDAIGVYEDDGDEHYIQVILEAEDDNYFRLRIDQLNIIAIDTFNVEYIVPFENKISNDNNYDIEINYFTSNSDDIELQYFDSDWHSIAILDSTIQITETLRINSYNKPKFRIIRPYENEEAFDNATIYINKLRVKSDYKILVNSYLYDYKYSVLGWEYSESTKASLLDYKIQNGIGNFSYEVNSSMMNHYNKDLELVIPSQEFTLGLNFSFLINISLTFSVKIFTTRYIIPSEASLEINDIPVSDTFLGEGFIVLDSYPSVLNIFATKEIYYVINITIEFSLSFDLEVISSNYLKKQFRLISDHQLNLTLLEVNNNLTITNIFINFMDYGSENPLEIDIGMLPNQQFTVEVLLSKDIYLPLEYEGTEFQVTENPRTDVNTIELITYLESNRNYNHWYVENHLDILSMLLTNTRTNSTIKSFTKEGDRFYFNDPALINDNYRAEILLNPNYEISFEIMENNGTHSRIRVYYKADLYLENVTLCISLRDEYCFNEIWTLGAKQNMNSFVLEIPNITIYPMMSNLIIEGWGSIPLAYIDSFESDQDYSQLAEGEIIGFAGFLRYPKYSTVFNLAVNEEWNCHDLYYDNEIYKPAKVSNKLLRIEGEEFAPEVEDSFLYFEAKPFKSVTVEEKNGFIIIEIESELAVDHLYFSGNLREAGINIEGVHTLEVRDTPSKIENLNDDYGDLYFMIDRVEAGKNIIKIEIIKTPASLLIITTILTFMASGAFIGLYYYFYYNEQAFMNFKGRLNDTTLKMIEKIRMRRQKGKGVKSFSIEVKDDKMFVNLDDKNKELK